MIGIITKNFKWIALLVLGIGFLSKNGFSFLTDLFAPKTDAPEKSEGGATISDEAAQIYAERLYDAMEGMGTDEDSIYAIFRYLNNRADFNKVYNAFGMRQYSRTWGNMGDPITSGRYDLTTWLTYELTESDQKDLVNQNPQLQIF